MACEASTIQQDDTDGVCSLLSRLARPRTVGDPRMWAARGCRRGTKCDQTGEARASVSPEHTGGQLLVVVALFNWLK